MQWSNATVFGHATGTHPARMLTRARIQLKDNANAPDAATDPQAGRDHGCSAMTVRRDCQRFAAEGLDATLHCERTRRCIAKSHRPTVSQARRNVGVPADRCRLLTGPRVPRPLDDAAVGRAAGGIGEGRRQRSLAWLGSPPSKRTPMSRVRKLTPKRNSASGWASAKGILTEAQQDFVRDELRDDTANFERCTALRCTAWRCGREGDSSHSRAAAGDDHERVLSLTPPRLGLFRLRFRLRKPVDQP